MANPNLDVRLLKEDEQDVAVRILVECFGDHYKDAAPIDVMATFVADYPYPPKSFIALYDGQYCGFVQTVTAYIHKNTHSILWLAVLPEFRRRGFAAKIMHVAEQYVVDKFFGGKDGSFILVAEYKSEYYERLGYVGGLVTYDGFPVMIKHIRAR